MKLFDRKGFSENRKRYRRYSRKRVKNIHLDMLMNCEGGVKVIYGKDILYEGKNTRKAADAFDAVVKTILI